MLFTDISPEKATKDISPVREQTSAIFHSQRKGKRRATWTEPQGSLVIKETTVCENMKQRWGLLFLRTTKSQILCDNEYRKAQGCKTR